MAPHAAHRHCQINGSRDVRRRVAASTLRLCCGWPASQVEIACHLIRNETRAVGIDVAVTVSALLMHVEALWHDDLKVILGARQRDIKQTPFLLDFGRRTGRKVRWQATV